MAHEQTRLVPVPRRQRLRSVAQVDLASLVANERMVSRTVGTVLPMFGRESLGGPSAICVRESERKGREL